MTVITPNIEFIHLGTDNSIDLLFEEDFQAPDMTVTSRIVLEWVSAGFVVDSNTAPPGAFDWNSDGAQGIVHFKLGQLSPPPPVGCWGIKLTVYDGTPEAFVWASTAPAFPQQLAFCAIEG